MQAVSRDEFETVKQLLASAARYAERASRQTADNATQIADNAEGIQELKLIQAENSALIRRNAEQIANNAEGIQELKLRQAENAIQIERNTKGIAALAERQDRFQAQLAETRNLVDNNTKGIQELSVSIDGLREAMRRSYEDMVRMLTQYAEEAAADRQVIREMVAAMFRHQSNGGGES